MKKTILFLAIMLANGMLFTGCSLRQNNPTAPEEQAKALLPSELNKSKTAYAQWVYVGGPGDPWPECGMSSRRAHFQFVGDSTGPQPIDYIQYGDIKRVTLPGTPDSWTIFNATIDASGPGTHCLYSEAGNESSPTTCKEMTLRADLWWRTYPFQAKWSKYAYLPTWTEYDVAGQIVYGTFCWIDTWESKCESLHQFDDDTNDPPCWSPPRLKTQFRSLSVESIAKK